jgi:hypothetical protein
MHILVVADLLPERAYTIRIKLRVVFVQVLVQIQ